MFKTWIKTWPLVAIYFVFVFHVQTRITEWFVVQIITYEASAFSKQVLFSDTLKKDYAINWIYIRVSTVIANESSLYVS